MLDLAHPMTQHRFAAARVDGRLLTLAKLVPIALTQERERLLGISKEPLENLRQLNRDHFGASVFIFEAIAELERALTNLADMKTTPIEGNAYAIATCPACGATLAHVHSVYMPKPEQRWSVYCSSCLDGISPARRKLEWVDGFGTWAI